MSKGHAEVEEEVEDVDEEERKPATVVIVSNVSTS